MPVRSKKDSLLPADLINALYLAYQDLVEHCLMTKEAVRKDNEDYPVYIPTFGRSEDETGSPEAREAAIESIIRLFFPNEANWVPEAGILCASQETVSVIEALNKSKTAFKNAVLAIRNFHNDGDSSSAHISKLIRDEITDRGYRTESLKKAMSTIGIGTLDLKRCYAQIRIMPPGLTVFSWTWATTHTRMKKISFDQAQELAKNLAEERTSEVALELLNRCKSNENFALKVTLPNQLRANYAFRKGESIVRKSCPVSGVVIAQQRNMPRKLWRDNPGQIKDQVRLPRESDIESTPFIESLNLYRYAC